MALRGDLFLLLLFWILCCCRQTSAEVCYISPAGAQLPDCTNELNPCRTFTNAFNSIPVCTEINAFSNAGPYTGAANTDLSVGWPLVIRGYGGIAVIELQRQGRFLQVSQDSVSVSNWTLILQDLIIREGEFVGNPGGGCVNIQLLNPAGFSLAEAALINNVEFDGCVSAGNDPTGAGLRVQDVPLVMRNSIFRNMRLVCTPLGSEDCWGSAFRMERTQDSSVNDLLVEDCLFEANYLENRQETGLLTSTGGAAMCVGTKGRTNTRSFTMRRTHVLNNFVVHVGVNGGEELMGAVAVFEYNTLIECTRSELGQCLFSGNIAQTLVGSEPSAEAYGGGAFATSGFGTTPTVNMVNVVFSNNTVLCANPAVCQGAGIRFGGGAVSARDLTLEGCRFCNNSAPGSDNSHIIVPFGTLTAELPANIFQCNSTGPIIRPFAAASNCTPPECQIRQPATYEQGGICTECLAAFPSITPSATITPTPSPSPSPSPTAVYFHSLCILSVARGECVDCRK